MIDYQNVIVRKPWGYEYLMYQNEHVGVWFLSIREDARTSLHCHPNKKTGLILLDGEAQVSFLNDSKPLKALSKLNIAKGIFHSTTGISPGGISVIEVETPREKENLVRLDDEYERDQVTYEGPEAMIPMNETCVRLDPPEQGREFRYSLAGCSLKVVKFRTSEELRHRPAEEVIAVLEGGLVSNSGDPVLSPGDVLSGDTLDRLAEKFSISPQGTSLLVIRKENSNLR